MPLEERESVDAAVRHVEFLDTEIAAVERLIAQQALSRPEIKRLMTVPGVNLIGAASFIAAVGNANRFLTSRKLVAYLGLDPRVKQSGEAPARSGRISKRGSAHGRWTLVEAAWSTVLRPGPLRAFYQRVRARRGHGKAIVATARKLAILLWCMLNRREDHAHQQRGVALLAPCWGIWTAEYPRRAMRVSATLLRVLFARMRVGVLALARLLLVSAAAVSALLPVAAASAAPRAKRKEHLVTLEWVGDIALSTQRGLPPGGLSQALAPVRSFLRGVDETAGNLEGTLSIGGTSKCGGIGGGKCFAFQAPPSTAGQLRALGFDLMNIANNHALDYGYAGRGQTIGALRSAGIAYTGLRGGIAYRRVAGVQMAFLGFAPYSFAGDLLDIPAAQALVRRARAHAALVVVIIHAGAEGAGALHTPHGSEYYLGEDRGNPRAFAHAVIDAGASIVLGSGPHVIRGIERYRGRVIAYSLGNFVGYHTLSDIGVLSQSGILRVTLGKNGRVLAGRWFSIRIVDGLPRPDPANAAAKLVASLSRQDFPSEHFDIGPRGFFRIGR